MSTLRHGRWQLAAAATQPRRAGGRSPQWVLAVLVSKTLETSVQASRMEQSEKARGGVTLYTGRDLEDQPCATCMEKCSRRQGRETLGPAVALRDPSLEAASETAEGVGDGGAGARQRRAVLERGSARKTAAAARLAFVVDTVRRVSGSPRGKSRVVSDAVLALAVAVLALIRIVVRVVCFVATFP